LFNKKKRKKEFGSLELSREEFLKTKPVRNPNAKWKVDEEGKTVITIPQPPQQKKGFLSKLLSASDEKKFRIDEIGSYIWSLCDGTHIMSDIMETLNQKFKLNLEEAETGLQKYFGQLSAKGLVGFILPSETQTRFKEKLKSD
jgi:hypothetical protein